MPDNCILNSTFRLLSRNTSALNNVLRSAPGGENLNEAKGDIRTKKKPRKEKCMRHFVHTTLSARGGEQ